jgi:hypothetical protein
MLALCGIMRPHANTMRPHANTMRPRASGFSAGTLAASASAARPHAGGALPSPGHGPRSRLVVALSAVCCMSAADQARLLVATAAAGCVRATCCLPPSPSQLPAHSQQWPGGPGQGSAGGRGCPSDCLCFVLCCELRRGGTKDVAREEARSRQRSKSGGPGARRGWNTSNPITETSARRQRHVLGVW